MTLDIGMNGRGSLKVFLAIALVVGLAVAVMLRLGDSSAALKPGKAISVKSTYAFSEQAAGNFLRSLSTPSGLLRTYPGSYTIYLSDDQQLDYAALLKLNAISSAREINSTLKTILGGLYGNFNPVTCSYGNWNGVDVVLGVYLPIPCQGSEWNMYSGRDVALGNEDSFTVRETKWGGLMGSGYSNYADLELYYSMNQLHFRNYLQAVKAFEHTNSMWDGNGFADTAFQASHEYTSYKLALDLIAFKALMNDSHTEGSVVSYTSTMNQVQDKMSKLQGADGGVITNYQLANGVIQIPPNTFENGETTSLFVLSG